MLILQSAPIKQILDINKLTCHTSNMKTLNQKQLERLKTIIQCGYEDCEMALCNDWDKSDEGFEALRDNLLEAARLLEIEIIPYVPVGNR